MHRPSPHRIVLAALVVAAAGLEVAAPSTLAAANHKTFSETLWVDPTGTTAGTEWPTTDVGTTTSKTITAGAHDFFFQITNTSSGPNAVPFGSAQLQVPTGFTGISASLVSAPSNFALAGTGTSSPITIVSSGPTGSGIGPGASIVIEVTATAPAAGVCPSTWTTGVKQSNDFSGSGNDFSGNSVSTPVAGSSHLVWTTQPSDVQYSTTMSPSPTVKVEDACGNTDTSMDPLTITATDVSADAASNGTTFTATTSSGVATFSTISYSTFGYDHVLHATASGVSDCASGASCYSASFHVYQLLKSCGTNGCSSGDLPDNPSNPTTIGNVKVGGGTGSTVLAVDVSGDPSVFGTCGQPTNVSPEPALGTTVTVNVANRGKQVTIELTKYYVNLIPNNGTPFMDICLNIPLAQQTATNGFVDKFNNVDNNVYQGLLADCLTSTDTGPCIVTRYKRAGNEYITFNLPAGDPNHSVY